MIHPMEAFVAYVQPFLPDFVVRWVVWLYLAYQLRRLNRLDHPMKELRTVKRIKRQGREEEEDGKSKFERVAERTDAANEQHYEVPTEFFVGHLGPCRKYSSCEWGPIKGELRTKGNSGAEAAAYTPPKTLAEAETRTFDSYLSKMGIDEVPADGSGRVLEIGCGWGSFLLYAATKHPRVAFVGFSNSATQIAHIGAEAKARGLANVTALRLDINDFCDAEIRPAAVFGTSSCSNNPHTKGGKDDGRGGKSADRRQPSPPAVEGGRSGASNPNYSSLKFDRIFSCECLEHSKDYGKAFQAMSEVLKDDGKVSSSKRAMVTAASMDYVALWTVRLMRTACLHRMMALIAP